MKFIPRHLKSDAYSFYTEQSVSDFKADLQKLFDNKWYDFSINLTGHFSADNEFEVTKKSLLPFQSLVH